MIPFAWSSKYPRKLSWISDNKNLKYRKGDIIKFKDYYGIVLNRYKYTKHLKKHGFKANISDYGVLFMMINGPKIYKSYMVLCNSDLIKTNYNFKDILDHEEFYIDPCKKCKKDKCSKTCAEKIYKSKEFIVNNLNIDFFYNLERNKI